jgi:hypothetical protein
MMIGRMICAMVFGVTAMAWGQARNSEDARVVLVMTDGMRWQEVFRGADESLLTPERYFDKRDVSALKERYLAATAEERRQKLMPFLWSTFVPQGQIYGDRDAGSDAYVTNGFNFSYPGYSETLTGHGDKRIDSNDDRPNPNLTVLAWLSRQTGFQGGVAAFGAWHVIANAVNPEKCVSCMVNAGYDRVDMSPMTNGMKLLNGIKANSPRVWEDEAYDAPVFETALEYIRAKKPRVVFLSLGETDEWAHAGNYGEYLESAHRVDGYMKRLWDELQAMPEYKGKTTMILLVDHGRGSAPEEWKSHGQKVPESKYIFMGFMGRDVPRLGVRSGVAPVTQSQVAATLAKYLGLDWNSQEKQAGQPIAAAVK